MGTLGDHFPDSMRQTFADQHVQAGQVLYIFCHFTNPEKEKYLVVVGCGPNCLAFVINSRIAPFLARDPALRACQVPIVPSDYGFLDHDSFIDCTQVFQIPRTELQHQLSVDTSRAKGELNKATKSEIIRVVQIAQTISPRHKRAIIASLS